jgi:hypothetical protein
MRPALLATSLVLLAVLPAMADGGIQPADIPMNALTPHIPYGERVAASDYYDVYYDGAYGPYTDGYWGTDGNYWYLSGLSSSIWARDGGGHFRRTPADGFALVRGSEVQREN